MLDLIGIGLGPFNLSLAALLTKTDLDAKFFEQKAEFNWHKGMILPHTTLQVPFMADLVTMIDPTSPYSFLNYLHSQHRLLKFYFLEEFKIYRREYNHYCQWVAGQLDSLAFATEVIDVSFIDSTGCPDNITGKHKVEGKRGFRVTVRAQGQLKTYYAKNIVIGTGTQPTLPPALQDIARQAPERCMHTANFTEHFNLSALEKPSHSKDEPTKIAVLGSGQSSAEVYRALFDMQFEQQFDERDKPKFQLDWITRSSGFFPMEYSPLGLEHFSPAYTDYFYHLPASTKAAVAANQDLLYKGMGFETIRDIYHKLYERSVTNQQLHSTLLSNCEVVGATLTLNDRLSVTFHQREQNQSFSADYDCIIAGTGYRHALPNCLNKLLPYIDKDEFDQPKIDRDYTLVYQDSAIKEAKRVGKGKVFVQNQELHSHGVGAPDLGLGAYRAGYIINQLTNKTIYDTEALQVFQQFGA